MYTIVIVGGNAAGMTAASRARRLDPRLEIAVLEKSPFVSYSTCGIPYFVSGDVSAEDLIAFTPARLLQERNIHAEPNVRVTAIQPSRRQVEGERVDTGERVSRRFDRLLIASGVRAKIPEIPGTGLDNVFSITTLEDATRLTPALESLQRIVVVGGGYVGLEMAESLHRRGKDVALFERAGHVMPSLDADMSRIVEYELERYGVRVHTHRPVEALVGPEGRITGVKAHGSLGLEAADAVLLDTGVQPETELARGAGVRIGPTGAIAVSEHLETNVPGIYAAGNCAEAYCLLRQRPIAHWVGTVAAKQGRVAGENLAGHRSKFSGTVGTTILRVFDLAVGRTGLSTAQALEERFDIVSARIEAFDRAGYDPSRKRIWVKLVADRESHRLLGAQSVGYGDVAKRIDVAAAALTAQMTVEELAQLDLSYAPPFGTLWDPMIVAAQAVLRKML